MSRVLEALPFEFLQNIDWSEKRNKLASVLAGTLFFSGWWFALDASASHHPDTRDHFHLCGVFSTISMFMVNAVSNSLLRGEGFTEGCLGSLGAKIWFFVGFMMGFGSFIGNHRVIQRKSLISSPTCRKLLHTLWGICGRWRQREQPLPDYLPRCRLLSAEPFHSGLKHHLQVWENGRYVGLVWEYLVT